MRAADQRKVVRTLINIGRHTERSGELVSNDSDQVVIAGHCAVAVISWLQAHLGERIEQTIDSMPDDWNELGRLQKALLLRNAEFELRVPLDELETTRFPDERALDQFKRKIDAAVAPLSSPKSLTAKSGVFASARILRGNGTHEIARIIHSIRGEGISFKDWLSKKFRGNTQLLQEIDDIIALRNNFADGLGERRPTMREARVHFVRVRQLVGLIDRYISGEG